MCRGKVAPRSEENMQNLASSLIAELEEKEFLGPDNLDLLKDLLKDVKEWAFLEEVEKFESKRKEYFDLLEQIIRALDELNDLERLVSICRGKIPRERGKATFVMYDHCLRNWKLTIVWELTVLAF